MLQDEARKIAEAINERVNADAADRDVRATVATDQTRPSGVPLGASRPRFIRYQIQISDGKRLARLDLDQAEMLLNGLEPGCDADRVFDAIRSHDVSIEDAPGAQA